MGIFQSCSNKGTRMRKLALARKEMRTTRELVFEVLAFAVRHGAFIHNVFQHVLHCK
jgi:hypothetical protein